MKKKNNKNINPIADWFLQLAFLLLMYYISHNLFLISVEFSIIISILALIYYQIVDLKKQEVDEK